MKEMKRAIIHGIIHTGDEIINDGVIVTENGIIVSVQSEVPEAVDHSYPRLAIH